MSSSSSSNPPENMHRNLVLVGKTGNGKSATANSIVGKRIFKSLASAGSVTEECQVATVKLKDGYTINVIDTPGFFDFSSQSELIGDEVIKCVENAQDGIHAFLLVLSIRTRFTPEEEAVISNLQMLFGDKVLRFMIVVFTGGDDLEDGGITFEQYLGEEKFPLRLKEFITQTQNGCVVFNNRCTDEPRKELQVQKLVTTIEDAMLRNKGRPFMDELIDLQAGVIKARRQVGQDAEKARLAEEKMEEFIQKLTVKLRLEALELEEKLEKAERKAEKSEEEISKLKGKLETTQKRVHELESKKCSIL